MTGTFVSIRFGDGLMDRIHYKEHKDIKHKKRHKLIMMLILFSFTLVLYKILLAKLGINIKL
ncbi:MAG: hypothetical protein GXP45_00100 [bacterium]|nr:hypothetical protein [bacterium]